MTCTLDYVGHLNPDSRVKSSVGGTWESLFFQSTQMILINRVADH